MRRRYDLYVIASLIAISGFFGWYLSKKDIEPHPTTSQTQTQSADSGLEYQLQFPEEKRGKSKLRHPIDIRQLLNLNYHPETPATEGFYRPLDISMDDLVEMLSQGCAGRCTYVEDENGMITKIIEEDDGEIHEWFGEIRGPNQERYSVRYNGVNYWVFIDKEGLFHIGKSKNIMEFEEAHYAYSFSQQEWKPAILEK